jgi:hypothetical protein
MAIAQQCRRPIDVGNKQFHLLNPFAAPVQETGDGARAARLAGSEDVERNFGRKMQLEFPGILVGRNVSERRRIVRGMDMLKRLRPHRDTDRRRAGEKRSEFRVVSPGSGGRFGKRRALFVEESGGAGPGGGIGGRKRGDEASGFRSNHAVELMRRHRRGQRVSRRRRQLREEMGVRDGPAQSRRKLISSVTITAAGCPFGPMAGLKRQVRTMSMAC